VVGSLGIIAVISLLKTMAMVRELGAERLSRSRDTGA